jgi:SPP1 gp7 family putative phage head morphogenesis protein
VLALASYKVQLAVTDKYAAQLRRAYKQSIRDSINQTNWDWVAKNVPYGYQAVYNAIQWAPWWPVPLLTKAYVEMAKKTDIQKDAGVINPEDFMMDNPGAERWLLQYAATEVTGITDNTKAMLRNVVFEGQRDQLTYQQTAERLKEHLGLTQGQEIAVENYKKTLIKAGKTPAQVDKLTRIYYNKLLSYRAETIALTESHTATSHAWVDQVQDAESRGVLDGYRLRWLTTPDDRLCDQCAPMSGRTGSIKSGEVDGETPPLHQRCRCVLVTEKI